jgi:hypothetical protein
MSVTRVYEGSSVNTILNDLVDGKLSVEEAEGLIGVLLAEQYDAGYAAHDVSYGEYGYI